MPSRRQRRLRNRHLLRTGIPQQDLSRIGASADEVRVEGGESYRQDVGLMEETLSAFAIRPEAYYLTWEWKINSGRSSKCIFHTATSPSGSLMASGFLLNAAALSSGYCTP